MPRLLVLSFIAAAWLISYLTILDHPLGLAKFPGSPCTAFQSWITSRQATSKDVQDAVPLPLLGDFDFSTAAIKSAGSQALLSWAGWPSRMKFAAFHSYTLDQLESSPPLQIGAFLIVLPGPSNRSPPRRQESTQPWISVDSPDLAESLPLNSLNNFASMLKKSGLINRGLINRFSIEVAPPHLLPLCQTGDGACAIWEGSTGRIILNADVARRIGFSPTISKLLDRFVDTFIGEVAGLAVDHSPKLQRKNGDDRSITLALESVDMGETMENSPSEAHRIANIVSQAATAAITVLLAAQALPLWWCILCPTVLGLLAPFIFNFGLTAAADQLCSVLQLPTDECADLWWASFALALVLSLGSAVPIVYVCRLPDCIKHALATNS